MKQSIYLETSVIGYLTSRPSRDVVVAARQELTRQLVEAIAVEFEVYVSEIVVREASAGNAEEAAARVKAIEGYPELDVDEQARELAAALIADGPIPKENPADALHIAVAAVNGIDYLVTWNFAHINNARLKGKVVAVVEAHGFECPTLCSPEELMGDEV